MGGVGIVSSVVMVLGESSFMACSRWLLAMKRGLFGVFSSFFMVCCISCVGSSFWASVFRNWNASLSSWYPAESVMLTAFWSFSSIVVAVVVICEGFLRFCLVYYCVELVCVFSSFRCVCSRHGF